MKPMHPRRRMLKIIRDMEQFIRDVRWWNQHRTDAEPFDFGRELSALPVAKQALEAWDAGDMPRHKQLWDQVISISHSGDHHAER